MKNNRGIYILLPLVFVVWGIIGYRIVKYFKQDNVVAKPEQKEIKFEPEKFQNDTFSILANYRDPFLSNIKSEGSYKISIGNNHLLNYQKSVSPFVNEKSPVVVYKGIIKNGVLKKTFAIVSVDGKSKSVMSGQTIDKVKILNITSDSIQIIYSGEKRKIYRK